MPKLELFGLSKFYGKKAAVQDLSLTLDTGTFIALLGPSGCGKTTLLRMIAGLEKPDQGTIQIGEQVVAGPGTFVPPEHRGLGMVFQTYALWPHLSVRENVLFPLKLRAKRMAPPRSSKADLIAEAQAALKWVELGDYGDRFPHQLSGGQQQRVALARAMAIRPPLLLLDEPLSNLDARLRAEMRREIRKLHRELASTTTLIYVTHDQQEAFEMATQVAVLNDGRIAQLGTPDEVRSHPNPGFVKEFLE